MNFWSAVVACVCCVCFVIIVAGDELVNIIEAWRGTRYEEDDETIDSYGDGSKD